MRNLGKDIIPLAIFTVPIGFLLLLLCVSSHQMYLMIKIGDLVTANFAPSPEISSLSLPIISKYV